MILSQQNKERLIIIFLLVLIALGAMFLLKPSFHHEKRGMVIEKIVNADRNGNPQHHLIVTSTDGNIFDVYSTVQNYYTINKGDSVRYTVSGPNALAIEKIK